MVRRVLLAFVTVLFLVNARQRAVQHPSVLPLSDPPRDAFTFSEPLKVVTRHVALDLNVDFYEQRLRGTATLDIENLIGTRKLVLDTEKLEIIRITRDGGTPALYSVGDETANGAPLTIAIEPATRSVTIEYATSPNASGLNWNTAAQSFGRMQPYLYSLNEPVGARSWIPLQDTPSVRVTCSATIQAPAGLLALMTADSNPRETNASGVYSFAMTQPIPSYLISLAVGRLQYHAFDARTGVYAEPELIADAAWELQYLPDMLAAAERILGPDPFPRHDLLLAPPTFIVGGMEHPMLNLINPFSVVGGNHPAQPEPKLLIAHELAHSWAGDATTLGSWNDVWLNEGITSYLTLRILEEMQGRDRANLTWFLDRRSYENYVHSTNDLSVTALHRDVPNAWSGFNATSYTKGELFIRTLEDLMGRAALDAFLRDYFAEFAFHWVDDRNFLVALRAALNGNESGLRLEEWIYGTGVPSNITAPTSSVIYNRAAANAQALATGAKIATLGPSQWSDLELDLFLQLAWDAIQPRMAEVDAALALSARNTPPLNWLLIGITARYAPAYSGVERVLMRGGTNGNVVTLYTYLISTAEGRTIARDVFPRARERYHPNVAAQVEGLLNVAPQRAAA